MSKIAVLFPGIGYHADKPLLYYSGKLAASMGYEVLKILYPPCEVNLKGADSDQIHAFVNECLGAADAILKEVKPSGNDDILFISKSIGTAIAAAYAGSKEWNVSHVYFTPLVETFAYVKKGSGIAFNGTKDNWADHNEVCRLCREADIPVTTIDNANHSLETGVVTTDTEIICKVMRSVEEYLRSL
ncbi:MAG: alpha/beta hydrolase [Lachnospiraceae bacterium]|nr:alpha/beta hydrolase [Lachnospiraceae bacterium]MBR6486282.1 alpha/beta hydrolase [Lachnospiraceae bacterium]